MLNLHNKALKYNIFHTFACFLAKIVFINYFNHQLINNVE